MEQINNNTNTNINTNKIADKFFVYGTLRPSISAEYSNIVHNNHGFNLSYSKAKLLGALLYYLPKQNYPSIKFTSNDKNTVIGEIISTDNYEMTKKVFDEIEGYPNLFNKKEHMCLNLETNTFENVWVYFLNKLDSLDINDENNFGLSESEVSSKEYIIDNRKGICIKKDCVCLSNNEYTEYVLVKNGDFENVKSNK